MAASQAGNTMLRIKNILRKLRGLAHSRAHGDAAAADAALEAIAAIQQLTAERDTHFQNWTRATMGVIDLQHRLNDLKINGPLPNSNGDRDDRTY